MPTRLNLRVKTDSIFRASLISSKRLHIWITGRGTGKSYVCPAFSTAEMLENDYIRGLIVRNSYEAIKDSIFLSFKDRVEELNIPNLVALETGREIRYLSNFYRGFGFRSSSSNQKAKAKSLTDFNRVIIEEAEEVGYKDFRQLSDSIRTKKGDIKIYLLTNPPSKNHWIVKTYLDLTEHEEHRGYYIPKLKKEWEDTTCLVVGDYRSNLDNLDIEKVKEYENYGNPNHPSYDLDYYCTQILGLIPEVKTGLIYTKHKKLENWDDELESKLSNLAYGLDFGHTHPLSLVLSGNIDDEGRSLYAYQPIYQSGLTETTIIDEFNRLKIKKDIEIIADSARPELIEAIRKAGYTITSADKKFMGVSGQINKLQEHTIYYYDNTKYVFKDEQYRSNIEYELNNYQWLESKAGLKEEPKKSADDFVDALRYSRARQLGMSDEKQFITPIYF